jgi:SAM-dependent methyltransferase
MTNELPVPPSLWRTNQPDEDAWMSSAVGLLDLVAAELQVPDLGEVRLLDMGCGTKFTKAIIERNLPIGRYVGIDTSLDVISHLRRHVDDPRFEFHHIDVYNELYNDGGVALDSIEVLPLDGERFDAICLFSVFTHLGPHDYHQMLRLLRPHIEPDGRLVFSLFINRPIAVDDHDDGLTEEVERRLADPTREDLAVFGAALEAKLRSADPEVVARFEAAVAIAGPASPADSPTRSPESVPDFVDAHPDKPLMWARYSQRYANELIEGTGWRPVALHPPNDIVQHYFTCIPG